MGGMEYHDHQGSTVLLFGPQAVSFNRQSLDKLRHTLLEGTIGKHWVLNTVAELPRYWDTLTEKIPKIKGTVQGEKLLADLSLWLQQATLGDNGKGELEDLPNLVLTPLVVLTQLTQYWRYLEFNRSSRGNGANIDLQADLITRQKDGETTRVETLGFCTGLLSAFAVASARNQDEFEQYGAVAVRLAMLVGALVDAQESWNKDLGRGPSKSYATAWRNTQQGEEMRRIIDNLFPEAYISVLYDEARATVTTSQNTSSALLQQLRGAGITTAEVGLRGHFHSPNTDFRDITDVLIELCKSIPDLCFPSPSELAMPTYTNDAPNGEPIVGSAGSLTEVVLRGILVQQSNWYGTFSAVQTARIGNNSLVISFGPDRCVPPTLMRRLGPRLMHFADLDEDMPQCLPSVLDPEAHSRHRQQQQLAVDDDAIAVVGMSIKVAGADDVDEFSQMLRTGKSQHELISPERLMFDTLWREGDKDPKRNWYGNFIRDADAFDHKFFKRSPRESSTMDPQQRLFLQASYQAVEQSGYFNETASSCEGRDKKHVGVYLGACAGDYEHHAACHTANAFTATGNLKSFIPGKVSHYFGWTGPSMTFDTACSASAVAIHTACRNILSGECTAALAGGVAVMTNFLWFQNLAGASFLSPTGQCKPFDELADGYCRAEGIACVFLKKLSDAVADGNPVLGCIPSTAVYQNQNCTPLFVPNSPSLSQLFTDVMKKAHVDPRDVSFVEAHGTGTPVGDPAEYESIRLALGGPIRSKPLPIASVKGHIGHTEGASGVISLIKIIMMMHENYIPPQASFSKMSHYIKTSPTDLMEVPTSLRSWDEEYKVALINNYGASGSNASMIITQPPFSNRGQGSAPIRAQDDINNSSFPFWVPGLDARSINEYCAKLASFVQARLTTDITLADISFNVNRQSNRSLSSSLMFSCRSVPDLDEKLKNPGTIGIAPVKSERPVILCFGGQVSTFVGLDRNLYDKVSILRYHLDQCNAAMQSLGLSSIFPDIFSRSPIIDTVKLQTMLFAMQYASAKCWMDCGLENKIVAVVGHSFGEITALCLSGVLNLRDTVRLVAGRARLVRDAWGPDPGSMMAVEAEEEVVNKLLAEANQLYGGDYPASIACYNGPTSFTLAGSTKAIDTVASTIRQFGSVKSKRLNVTNSFHSTLVEPLLGRLDEVGKNLAFSDAVIPLERATETRPAPGTKITSKFISEHMRKPVYFNHAVRRLAKGHPSAVWLEAGSASTITIMANRSLAGMMSSDSHYFQAMSLTNTDKGLTSLTDATLALWKQGLPVTFWAHHASQALEYATLLLPPYQFDKARHWMELKSPIKAVAEAAAALAPSTDSVAAVQQPQDEKYLGLWTLAGYQDEENKTNPRFRINTGSDKYKSFISGHLIAQTAPICPATLEVDMAIEALFSLHPDWAASLLQPVIHDMVNYLPICVDPTRSVWLEFECLNENNTLWGWKIVSTSHSGDSAPSLHVDARIHVRSPNEATYQSEFSRFERLVTHSQCLSILAQTDEDDVDILQGRNVYRAFAEVVDYGKMYQGIRRLVGRADECAGKVQKWPTGETWLDVTLSDSFSQVGGLWANCMTDRNPTDMYIATGCELSMRSPRVVGQEKQNSTDSWHVLARHHHQSDKLYTTDVFVFNANNGVLTDVMLGIQYARVAKASMSKMLTRLTTDESALKSKPTQVQSAAVVKLESITPAPDPISQQHHQQQPTGTDTGVGSSRSAKVNQKEKKASSRPDITSNVRNLVSNVSGVEANEIELDTEMAEVGIDSLMGMEVAREVESVFKCTLDQNELMEATTLRRFIVCISNALYGPGGSDTTEDATEEDDDTDDSSSTGKGMSSESGASSTTSPSSGIDTPPPSVKAEKPETKPAAAVVNPPAQTNLKLSHSDILDCFGEVKMLTDRDIKHFKLDRIEKVIIAATNKLSMALVVEAFEKLGCHLRDATPGEILNRVPFQPQHGRLIEFVYTFLEQDARLVDIDVFSGQITRTSIPVPRKTSETIFHELIQAYPEFVVANRLTYYAGRHLADVLTGKSDGVRVIFGSLEGRDLVQALYCDHLFNRMNYGQMRDTIKLLVERLPRDQGPLKILEMGAGTGGTTYILAPFLASLDIPIEYTFTDLSPSMVANARRKFGKEYSFMRFVTHDIEKPPAEELCGQHIVIASNAVHATHNLVVSATNIRRALRPDGFMMILEMTEVVPFIDLIFGLLEGWWLFDDGRKHAIVTAEHWERDLHDAGFGHVDWTDGSLPENNFQKVMIALASGAQQERLPKPNHQNNLGDSVWAQPAQTGDVAAREEEANKYLTKYTAGFAAPEPSSSGHVGALLDGKDAVVIVTGATGSLGSHLIEGFARNPAVKSVVCVNRRTSTPVDKRQNEAFSSRGIELSASSWAKLRVLETDTAKPQLGLSTEEYTWLVHNGTHIVHNAWPMSGTRPVRGFEQQFQALRNLLDLARDIASYRYNDEGFRVGFQLVSSIGVVGHADKARVPEERVPLGAVLPNGYCEAKWVCERMLDETVCRYPERFRPMVVRPGQISGSRTSGYWNPVEHFAFLIKSAQTLRAWPDFDGVLQWIPVNDVAGTMVDLLCVEKLHNISDAFPVYHIDNPVGQPWKEMNPVLADALDISSDRVVPFHDWVKLVRRSPLPAETDNPAARLVDFLDYNFERMSCGGLILDTTKSKQHSSTMAGLGPVSAEVARRYITAWKTTGWLHA